jgi:hypothetical protein
LQLQEPQGCKQSNVNHASVRCKCGCQRPTFAKSFDQRQVPFQSQ